MPRPPWPARRARPWPRQPPPRCCHPASIQETSGSQRSAQPWQARTTTVARPPCWPSAPGDRPEGAAAGEVKFVQDRARRSGLGWTAVSRVVAPGRSAAARPPRSRSPRGRSVVTDIESTQQTSSQPRSLVPRRWPTLAGLGFAALIAFDLTSGVDLASVLAASAAVYLGAAALQRPAAAWPLFLATAAVITV